MIFRLISDPRIFNVVILIMFAAATIRWGFNGNMKQTVYWASAFVLNYAVTFMKD